MRTPKAQDKLYARTCKALEAQEDVRYKARGSREHLRHEVHMTKEHVLHEACEGS